MCHKKNKGNIYRIPETKMDVFKRKERRNEIVKYRFGLLEF